MVISVKELAKQAQSCLGVLFGLIFSATPQAEPPVEQRDQYPPSYVALLEDTYSANYLSEGGDLATKDLFQNIDMHNKSVLEIGSGLGGSAFFVADYYNASVLGLEISNELVSEARRRTPPALKNKVQFAKYHLAIPAEDASFDVVYSKGVLTHVKDKIPLLRELYRVLKPGGTLIINDWLSETKGSFGPKIQAMAETESLVLYPQTISDYLHQFKKTGFQQFKVKDVTEQYARYNNTIASKLGCEPKLTILREKYGHQQLEEVIQGYQLIAEGMQARDVIIITLSAKKPKRSKSRQ